jgi:hypothetical protein
MRLFCKGCQREVPVLHRNGPKGVKTDDWLCADCIDPKKVEPETKELTDLIAKKYYA